MWILVFDALENLQRAGELLLIIFEKKYFLGLTGAFHISSKRDCGHLPLLGRQMMIISFSSLHE